MKEIINALSVVLDLVWREDLEKKIIKLWVLYPNLELDSGLLMDVSEMII